MTLRFKRAAALATAPFLLILAVLHLPCVAWALEMTVAGPPPTELGGTTRFSATTDIDPALVEFRWTFGDGERTEFVAGLSEIEHTYTEPGHHSVNVLAREPAKPLIFKNVAFIHTVHRPLTAGKPAHSSTIIYDEARSRIYNVNPDNDSVGVVDAAALSLVAEIPVYGGPEALALAPDGRLWVVNRKDYAVAIIDLDTLQVTGGFRLPYASQPVGLVMGHASGAAYISLLATGQVLKIDTITLQVVGSLDAPWARGLALSHDESVLYVTRWISAGATGEVLQVATAQMQVTQRISLARDLGPDTDQTGRGLPNYIFSSAISPDGSELWVTGKKDNIERGPLRDGETLNQDNIVRPVVMSIDTATGQENIAHRLDLDDRNLPTQVTFSPLGDYAFVVVTGSAFIDVRDMYGERQSKTDIKNAGKAPRGAVLGPDGQLFVHSFLTRSVVVFDISQVLASVEFAPAMIANIPVVQNEQLSPEELRGKVVFYDSEDKRMTQEGYLSCASCHFDGFEDGRVWDFSQRGEGLRNTTSLLGRRGTGHGPVHWTANFDEIQDFEHEIRLLFNGSGFIEVEGEEADAGVKNINPPLSEPLQGQSPELDDLTKYLESLDTVNRSPYRNSDGTLTESARAGRVLFCKLGCDFCHAGTDFTDSIRELLHDVGTVGANSGGRAGEQLEGIDTPTLLGVWETAPYLHDGSAATIRDVLTTSNVGDQHGFVSSLAEAELQQLEAYLLQIDHAHAPKPLPFEAESAAFEADPACEAPRSPPLGMPSATVNVVQPSAPAAPRTATANAPGRSGSCGVATHEDTGNGLWSLLFGGMLALGWRRRQPGAAALYAVCVAAGAVLGCGEEQPGSAPLAIYEPGTPTATLPAVVDPVPELVGFPTRDEQHDALCSRAHQDSFFARLCVEPRPTITSMQDLIALLDLDEVRAFALTGNSTSLVAHAVSPINPRLVIFPRVDSELQSPEELNIIGFVRGEQFAEVVSRDSVTGEPRFYLLRFEQQCNYDAGCDLAALLTEELESNWTTYTVYDENDLADTPFDCISCHQRGEHGTPKFLRMQELRSPWTHWFPQRFVSRTESDEVLTALFLGAHDLDQFYGGIPIDSIANTVDGGSGAHLEALIRAEGDGDQPNVFEPRIEAEAKVDPAIPTWQRQFERTLTGEAITVPYPLADVTDPQKRTAAVAAYRGVVSGAIPRENMVDIRQVFSHDAEQKLGFFPAPDADGKTVLRQMCSRCHNGKMDPSLGRARFNVMAWEQLSGEAKETAISRIQSDDPALVMPPRRAGWLPEAAKLVAIEALSQ